MTREEAANILSNDIIDGYVEGNARFMDAFWFAVDNLKAEPCEDAVSRQAALKAFEELPHEYKTKEQRARTGGIAACQVIVEELPPVTPKQTAEWCTDCKEYDHEKHCCPRFNKVIRNTLNESINAVLDEILAEFRVKADGDDWYHTTDGLVWEEAIEIIDKHRKGESEKE